MRWAAGTRAPEQAGLVVFAAPPQQTQQSLLPPAQTPGTGSSRRRGPETSAQWPDWPSRQESGLC
ncbi:UNVERIFIED_CONTAM: hypothetical protein ACS92_04745 [Bacillus cereus]